MESNRLSTASNRLSTSANLASTSLNRLLIALNSLPTISANSSNLSSVWAFTEAMKVAINRDRPFVKYPLDVFPNQIDELGKSMPSAHTALAFTTATSIYLAYPKWYVALPAFTWATAVGYSRMYLGQHYPSDVLVGAIVGGGSACLTNWLNKKFIDKKKVKMVKTPD